MTRPSNPVLTKDRLVGGADGVIGSNDGIDNSVFQCLGWIASITCNNGGHFFTVDNGEANAVEDDPEAPEFCLLCP